MKVLLQNRFTRCFLGKGGRWVEMCARARAFRSGVEAIDYSVTHRLQNVRMLLHFESAPRYDIALDLTLG